MSFSQDTLSKNSQNFTTPSKSGALLRGLVFVSILLVGANLRAPFTSIAPLLSDIQKTLNLSATSSGMMVTLPLIAFMLFSPLVPKLSAKKGLEATIMFGLMLIAFGVVLRSCGYTWSLYVGTFFIGLGIAIENVLLPSWVKSRFPTQIALLTSSYVVSMGGFAALTSIAVVPLSQFSGGGWQLPSVLMMVFPLLAFMGCLAQHWLSTVLEKKHAQRSGSSERVTSTASSEGTNSPSPYLLPKDTLPHLLTSALAWQITFFLGLNSFLYYVACTWLPAIAASAHFSIEQAGNIHGVLQLCTALPGLVMPPLVKKCKDQKQLAFLTSLINLIAIAGIFILPSGLYVWAALLGFGVGASFLLALIFIGLRTHSVRQSTLLSSLAQTTGYFIAAFGPVLMGTIHDAQGTWSAVLMVCFVVGVLMTFCGVLAGRDKVIH